MKGFTLIELLVSIVIFAVITTLVIVNLRGGGRGQELRLAADNLASLIRKAQVSSLAGSQIDGQVPIGGYGVNVSLCLIPPCPVSYFADVDGELDFDSPAELRETITLPSSIAVSQIAPASPLDLVFKPPQATACVNRDCSNVPVTSITLLEQETNQSRVIKVHQLSGQVTVE